MNEAERRAREAAEKAEQAASSASREMQEGADVGGETEPRPAGEQQYASQQFSESRTYYEEPRGRGPWPWVLGGAGALVVAGLAAWGIWAIVDDDDDDATSDVAGVQSDSVDIENDGFSEGDLEISIGDSIEFTNDGDDDCQMTANGAPVGNIAPGGSANFIPDETGVFLFQCEGVDDILEVTVEE